METKELEKTELKERIVQARELVLHNDDFNTFEHVIDCLISICDHNELQAEQCAYLVHYKGKSSIKRGVVEKLEPMFMALKLQNLTVEIK